MRRPVAVDRKVAQGREAVPLAEGRTLDEPHERLPAEVSVESMETQLSLIVSDAVLEHDARAVIERRVVVGKAVDGAVEGGRSSSPLA